LFPTIHSKELPIIKDGHPMARVNPYKMVSLLPRIGAFSR
jgi:hypothetical protein